MHLNYTYLQGYPAIYRKAFIFGCIQPDKNLTTYLKGSIQWQWFRGHNWDNAKKYIQKVSERLQRRKHLHLIDYYRLGKLIHYTADSFTYAHNKHYADNLSAHRGYERDLDSYLEHHLLLNADEIKFEIDPAVSVSDFIRSHHSQYMCDSPCIQNDVKYCIQMCTQVLQILLQAKRSAAT
jgi:hypothetical protein